MDLPIPHPPVPPLITVDEFNRRLRAWLEAGATGRLDGDLTSPWVKVGTALCRLSSETTPAGASAYLARLEDGAGVYSVVPSSTDVARRVVPGRSPFRIPGFYFYAQDPFDQPQIIEPVRAPMDGWMVAMLILDAVAVLHQRGHQLLRIYPNESGSGLHWRTRVIAADTVRFESWSWPEPDANPFAYTTADGYEVAGSLVDAATAPEQVADAILAAIGDPHASGRGRDWLYAGWYAEMLGACRWNRGLPVGDEPVVVRGGRHWRIGATATIEEPPPLASPS